MTALFLNRQEVQELTACTRHSDQIKELKRMGIPHYINRSGRPIIVRAHIEQRQPNQSQNPSPIRQWRSSKAE